MQLEGTYALEGTGQNNTVSPRNLFSYNRPSCWQEVYFQPRPGRQLLSEEPHLECLTEITMKGLLFSQLNSTFQEQQIAKHPARDSDVAKYTGLHQAGLHVAIWPNRLRSISTADKGAFIIGNNRVREEFDGTPLARLGLAYVDQNDIWQLVTLLSSI